MATALGNITISNVAVGGSAATALALGDVVVWQLGPEPVAATPLCFTAEGSNASVRLVHSGNAPTIELEYSTDNESWSSYTLGDTVTLASKGDKVYFRAADVNARTGSADRYRWESLYNNYFDCSNVSVSGKLVSVLRKDMDQTQLAPVTGMLQCLLRNFNNRNPQIVSAKDLELPQLSAYKGCTFKGMFANSTLSAAPAFPTNCQLSAEDFGFYFEACTSLASIDSPMMAVNGFGPGTFYNSPVHSMFTGTSNFNQSELVLEVKDIASIPSKALTKMFENATAFTGKLVIDMTSYASVPTIQSDTFDSYTKPANGTMEIRVPASLYDTWKNATNWTTLSSYIVPVS